jgi:hypothetical protein
VLETQSKDPAWSLEKEVLLDLIQYEKGKGQKERKGEKNKKGGWKGEGEEEREKVEPSKFSN